MIYKIPDLDYKYSDLEPYIDAKTMEIHHGKHHQSYVDNLNRTLEGVKDVDDLNVIDLLKNINKIPADRRQNVINNAGGHANHSFFWKIMTPKKSDLSQDLRDSLVATFGSVNLFKENLQRKH
jgi:superoxide dismutase, Fe-Mn family